MNLRKQFFENFKLYGVTSFTSYTPDILAKIEQAYRGGAGTVQLRIKQMDDGELLRIAFKVREISRHYGRNFVVNNRMDIALAVEADAVHVGQDDLPLPVLRDMARKFSSPILIGKSTHSLTQALDAEDEGADYIGVGPIFETPTKPDYVPVGLELVSEVRGRARIPFVAIGGINETNLEEVIQAGASTIAVVRAIFDAPNIQLATQKLSALLQQLEEKNASS